MNRQLMTRPMWFAIIVLALAAMAGCSGGGGGTTGGSGGNNNPTPSGNASPSTNSNWDKMVWDQDNWA